MNITDEYAQFVHSRTKNLGTFDSNLAHMALGIAGEAGELVDAIKKTYAYNKALEVDNVYEELGDLLFYIQGMLNFLEDEFTLEDLMLRNRGKLTKRYPQGYTDQAAIARADKMIQGELDV